MMICLKHIYLFTIGEQFTTIGPSCGNDDLQSSRDGLTIVYHNFAGQWAVVLIPR